jgi:serine/threonine protein kinase
MMESFRAGVILLGKYRVERVLGAGGMGVVLAVRHIDLGELFAIKLLHSGATPNANSVIRFMREARAAARLTSDHAVKVHDVGSLPDGTPYMIMEHLEGSDLSRVLQSRGAVPLEEAATLLHQACDAIAEAHELGIVHRDLKLANLFLTHRRNGAPCLKVLDFGISKQTNVTEQLTSADSMIGSPRYMSPEQMDDPQSVDGRSDIWAMGVVLYELTTGKAPFHGNSLPDLIRNVFTSVPAPPSRLRPELPVMLDEVIARCLSKSREGRYATIEEFTTAVRSLIARSGSPTTALEGPTEGPTEPVATSRVFISCRGDAEDDLNVALSFYEALTAVGVSTFLAPKNITDGEDWVSTVSQALRRCDACLVLLSPRAAVSELVAAELDLARQIAQSSAGKPSIVPVRVRFPERDAPGHPLQERLQDLRHLDWNGPDDTPAVLRGLLDSVGHDARARGPSAVEQAPPHRVVPRSSAPPSVLETPLELPGGIVSSKSAYYVARPSIEDACLREVKKPGALIRIKGPRQMGKTSLMTRVLEHAAEAGARRVAINLQMADSAILGNPSRFLRWLCAVVSRRLRIPPGRIDDAWDDIFGPKDNCTNYFEEHLLSEGDAMVLGLDNVDRVFDSPGTAEEFLSLLRAWHEMGKSQEPWPKLRLVLAYSTEMYLPMNINRSPFNVGLPVALSEWDAGMVRELAERHGLTERLPDVEELMSLLGGHPHLIRIALYHLAFGMSLGDVLATAATDQGLFADHLRHLLWQLESRPELREAAARVMAAKEPVRLSTELSFKLASLGVVALHGNEVRPSLELYRRYLTERLS